MLFITNRQLKESLRSRVSRVIHFDFFSNSPTNSVYFCERKNEDEYYEIGNINFFGKIIKSSYRNILLYIHCSNSLPEPDVFPKCQILQKLFDRYEKNEVQVIPIIWPCDKDIGFVRDYWHDRLSAEASAYSFSRVIEKFYSWRTVEPCLKSIHALCHGLGCAVFEKTINVWTENYGVGYFPLIFKNLFLVAANIRNDIFREGFSGYHISTSSRNVAVYYSANDMILSGTLQNLLLPPLKGIPLGLTGPKYYSDTPANVKSIDCSDIGTLYDVPTGHSYYLTGGNNDLALAGIVFDHIYETIRTGRINTVDGRQVILSADD